MAQEQEPKTDEDDGQNKDNNDNNQNNKPETGNDDVEYKVIKEMDKLLEKYYSSFGREKEFKTKNPEDGKEIGKFLYYCQDNEMDDKGLDDEFYVEDGKEQNPSDCLLVEFDKDEDTDKNNFPLHQQLQEKAQIEREIFNILKYIYEKRKLPPKQRSKLTINLNIPQNVADKIIKEVYKPQLSCIHTIKNEPGLLLYCYLISFFF